MCKTDEELIKEIEEKRRRAKKMIKTDEEIVKEIEERREIIKTTTREERVSVDNILPCPHCGEMLTNRKNPLKARKRRGISTSWYECYDCLGVYEVCVREISDL